MLTLASSPLNDSLVVTLEGRIDANSAKDLESRCLAWIDEGHHKLILDFGRVSFISSAGLRALLLVAKKVEPIQGSVKLVALNHTLKDVFDISGFSNLFQIYPSAQDAL